MTEVAVLTPDQLQALIEDTWRRAAEQTQQRDVLTREEVAELLRCDVRSVANWVRDKGLPEHSVGSSKRYRRSEIMAWLEGR